MTNIFSAQSHFEKYANVKSHLLYSPNSKEPEPVISILIPTFNDSPYFEEALMSALSQEGDFPYEIIICDNTPLRSGKNKTQKIIEDLSSNKIYYYRNEENIGMIGNWNRCIELAKSELITFCHSDDKLEANCLSTLLSIHENHPDKCITASYNTIDRDGKLLRRKKANERLFKFFRIRNVHKYSNFDIFMQSPGFGVGCLFEKKKMINLGGFSEEYYPSSDYALLTKYCFMYGMIYSELPTFSYRKACNESFNTWTLFANRDLFFRRCMIPQFFLPEIVLRFIMFANYKVSSDEFQRIWGRSYSKKKHIHNIIYRFVIKVTDIRKINWCFQRY
ncbi:MAG: glycosyltransferase family 2 protein [Treponema sp.]|nr:glycosyltransferase family 2 protein [Treponema sp.]